MIPLPLIGTIRMIIDMIFGRHSRDNSETPIERDIHIYLDSYYDPSSGSEDHIRSIGFYLSNN